MTHNAATIRRCCCCMAPAMGLYGRDAYCAEHRPSVGRRVTLSDVNSARGLMADGCSLAESAQHLGLMSTDLDLEMWRWIGREIPDDKPRRYAPDFEDAA